MFTLSIEHAITDFSIWKSAFDRFAEARAKGGVIGDRIRRPLDDPRHLIIDLDFETRERRITASARRRRAIADHRR